MNRIDRERKSLDAGAHLHKTRSHFTLVDVFVTIGVLSPQNLDAWRFRRVPCLEKVIRLNLAQINAGCRTLHASARRGNLHPTWTAYVKMGQRATHTPALHQIRRPQTRTRLGHSLPQARTAGKHCHIAFPAVNHARH